MARWLFKIEPSCYSFEDLQRDGSTCWDGVKNALALKHLRQEKPGVRIFLYYSAKAKAIVGETKAKSVTDGYVTVAPVKLFRQPVPLGDLKADKTLASWELVR